MYVVLGYYIKQFLQASEGTKNALIASFLHTLLYEISAASVTKLPVLQTLYILYMNNSQIPENT